MDLKGVKNQVEWCLKERAGTREDDMLLTISVWKNFYKEAFCDFLWVGLRQMEIDPPGDLLKKLNNKRMSDLPSTESIRRSRQKFNEEGKYLPCQKVQKARGREVPKVQEDIRGWNG